MRFIINIVCFLFLLPLIATAQTYKYIGVENGLSNRRIFDIQKDSVGYMWFLTNEGIDRYNGKDIKHYKLIEENKESSFPIHLGWLYFEEKGKLWVIGKAGRIFQYNQEHDVFNRVYKLPKTPVNISYGYMDCNHRIWLCSRYSIALYDTQTGEVHQMSNELKSSITSIEQVDNNHFFMGTDKGLRYVKLENETLQIVPLEPLDKIQAQISSLYFHQESQRLFIGTFEKGVFAYDIRQQRIIHSNTDLSDVNIARIKPLNQTELLIATEGMGIHKINMNSCISEPYIVSSYKSHNEMNSNNINDIYIDEEKRIWIANYPEGITIIDNRYKSYNWIKHSIGNRQSLVNDQVHSVIEDSDGDLWFGTSNGISLYQSKTGQWHSFLSSFDHQLKNKNHIFITLCEVSPGIIWAGGYTSGVYKINKRTLSVEYFSPYLLNPDNIRPDKYIRDIVKDSKGYIWSGGFYNLKCFDLSLNSVRLYPGINSVTAITEKDDGHMWIGTSAGLYLLDKESGRFQYVALQEETTYINTLYQAEDLSLYIGTNGSGVVVYNAKDNTFKHYHKDNCALISNNIYTILPESDGHILMSTENGISCFHPTEKTFHNWTKEQGLMSSCFSASSGTLRKNKGFVFGSTDGAIEFPEGTKLPDYVYSPMILSDFQILYQTVVPGSTNSPLKENINQTDRLKLKYNQNTFSLSISSINYDAPDNVTFYWKLEGFYDDWNRLGEEGHLRFTNLASGDYKLYIRAVSKEEPYLYFEERSIDISIARPVWFSFWAIACYVLLTVLMSVVGFRVMALRKQKKISDEKTRFFVNTAHDIRTPLTLIKAPLEEMLENKTLNEAETNNMHMALRNVNSLLRMTTNLINFERAEVYSPHLYIAEYELNTYIKEIYNNFQTYATIKHITFRYESNFSYMNVWFDKEKEALTIVKQFWPGLILSDIMMPEMRGDELCIAIKNDIETSHIPVVLLTALGDEKNILEGLHIGADEYIVKPFSINILKASIANLLANRALLRKRYANLEINTEEEPSTTTTCSNSLDWKFMSNVKRHIEENMDNPDFTVDVLCSLLNMSRTSFYSKLKALTGQAPADFVRNIRLKHAAELLKEGKYSVTEVAERTGFCDGKYFREVFKKYFNVSPSQYAKGDTPRSPKGEGE